MVRFPLLKSVTSLTEPGGTNHQIDLQNPDNLGAQSTDAGTVPNLKWSFSDSKTKLFNGGWTREQVGTDLPQSHDMAGAQQHLEKGAVRELHWHRVVCFPLFSEQGAWLISCRLSGATSTKAKSSSPLWTRAGTIKSISWA